MMRRGKGWSMKKTGQHRDFRPFTGSRSRSVATISVSTDIPSGRIAFLRYANESRIRGMHTMRAIHRATVYALFDAIFGRFSAAPWHIGGHRRTMADGARAFPFAPRPAPSGTPG